MLTAAANALLAQVDQRDGGFGRAPKFPQTMSIDSLLRHHRRTGDQAALDAALLSLDAMAAGGIYDHLGGGFARYSTDGRWLVPHFEKMLYDQALLARVYLHAWQLTGEPRYRQILDETIGYVLRDLRHPRGGFFSAEDADSEGVEGKFYVWSLDELRAIAGADADAAIEWYGVTAGGNLEGTNILERPVRGDLLRPEAVERARVALLAERETRIRPGPRRQGAHRVERPVPRDPRRGGGRHRQRRSGRRRRSPTPSSCAPSCAGPTAGGCARGRGRSTAGSRPARPRSSPTPPTTARWSTPSSAWPSSPARPAGSTRPAPRPTRWSSCSGTTRPAACSPPAPTPRRW